MSWFLGNLRNSEILERESGVGEHVCVIGEKVDRIRGSWWVARTWIDIVKSVKHPSEFF